MFCSAFFFFFIHSVPSHHHFRGAFCLHCHILMMSMTRSAPREMWKKKKKKTRRRKNITINCVPCGCLDDEMCAFIMFILLDVCWYVPGMPNKLSSTSHIRTFNRATIPSSSTKNAKMKKEDEKEIRICFFFRLFSFLTFRMNSTNARWNGKGRG